MGRRSGNRNRPKETETHDADAIDPVDAIESFEAATLRGDIRDAILAEFKTTPTPWQQMTEDEQDRVIRRANNIAMDLVNRAIIIAAGEGAPSLTAEVAQFTVKDGLKVQLAAIGNVENITRLAEHHGPAVLVLVEPSKFKGQRAAAKTDVVGDLKMPRNGAGVYGDELDGMKDITPGRPSLPPPGNGHDAEPFRDFE